MSNVVPINQKTLSIVPQQNAFTTAMSLVPIKKKRFGGRPPKGPNNPHTRKALSKEELERVFEAAKTASRYGHRDYCMMLIAYRHALRSSEISKLHWSMIDLDKKEIYIPRSKGGQSNYHPLSDLEIKELNWLPDHRGYVFKAQTGGNLQARAIFKIVARAGRLAGLNFPLHPHMFRHSKLTHLAERKTDAFILQNFAGHKDIRSTQEYVKEAKWQFEGLTED